MENITKVDIHRETIIGFIVIRDDAYKGNSSVVYTEPIYVWYDGIGNDTTIDKDQIIVGVLPAPARAYRVYGFGNDGKEVELGYEYPGAYHPDWVEELKARRKE